LSRRQAPPAVSGKYDPVIHIITDGSAGCVVCECVIRVGQEKKGYRRRQWCFARRKLYVSTFRSNGHPPKCTAATAAKDILLYYYHLRISRSTATVLYYIKYKNFTALKYMVYCVYLQYIFSIIIIIVPRRLSDVTITFVRQVRNFFFILRKLRGDPRPIWYNRTNHYTSTSVYIQHYGCRRPMSYTLYTADV